MQKIIDNYIMSTIFLFKMLNITVYTKLPMYEVLPPEVTTVFAPRRNNYVEFSVYPSHAQKNINCLLDKREYVNPYLFCVFVVVLILINIWHDNQCQIANVK